MTAANEHEPKISQGTHEFLTEILEHDAVLGGGDKEIVHRFRNGS